MSVILWILGVALLLLVLLLWVPFSLYVNTENSEYYASLKGIAKLSPHYANNHLQLAVTTPAYSFKISLDSLSKEKRERPRRKNKKRKTRARRKLKFSQMVKLAKRLARSLTVKRFYINLDTDNYTLNAQLIPLFSLLNGKAIRFNTNYSGINSCEILVITRPARIVWPMIQCFVFKN